MVLAISARVPALRTNSAHNRGPSTPFACCKKICLLIAAIRLASEAIATIVA